MGWIGGKGFGLLQLDRCDWGSEGRQVVRCPGSLPSQRSSGFRPVRLATRANILPPISSRS